MTGTDWGTGRDLMRARRAQRAPYAIGWASLTEAELRVARLVVSGLTNPQIASRLFLSRHTVNTHVRHAMQKLDVHNRVDLTREALRHDPNLVLSGEAGTACGGHRQAS